MGLMGCLSKGGCRKYSRSRDMSEKGKLRLKARYPNKESDGDNEGIKAS